MNDRWERRLHRWRYRLSRSAWLVRLLGMQAASVTPERRGLLLIQIDGLARRHLDTALAKGRMPFVRRLLDREHYRLHTMYSGVPSTTPAVQGELFYGARQAVPAFAFRDAETGEQVRMFSATTARRKQDALEAGGDAPLLRDGSAYCNIYTGGAAEPHFCAAALGWGQLTAGVRPWAWLLIALLFTPELLRAGAGLLLELVVALRDAVIGFINRRHPLQELEFVVRRVAVSVVLRELATLGATLDAARGLPVVEVNFLGYDEQAHHRGPDAHYALWSLGGIDDAIRRIWKAAARSPHREFDLWVYSDHGQERVTSYTDRYGRDVQEAAGEVVGRRVKASTRSPEHRPSAQTLRAAYLRGKSPEPLREDGRRPEDVEVIAMGPLGFVYYERELPRATWREIAAALVAEANIPLVLMAEPDGRARAWAAGREGCLPEDAERFLGPDHPFLEQTAEDLVRLAHHRDAGNLVIGGWAAGAAPLTYVLERGAHGGCGPDELSAFAVLPADAPLDDPDGEIPRPAVLREAALRARRAKAPAVPRRRTDATAGGALRVMTYNIHSCIGTDGRIAPERIARVIALAGADVVALQEVDVRRGRTGYAHQAQRIAEALDMHFHFHRTVSVAEEAYGHAVLSRLPLRVVRGGPLPTLLPKALEPRGALWVEIDVGGRPLQLVNTHLGLASGERLRQIEILLGAEWLGGRAGDAPLVLCGDLNAGPRSTVYRRLAAEFVDVQRADRGRRPEKTFLSQLPFRRIDHIFVRGPLEVDDARVLRSSLTRRASDHLPLVADLRFPEAR